MCWFRDDMIRDLSAFFFIIVNWLCVHHDIICNCNTRIFAFIVLCYQNLTTTNVFLPAGDSPQMGRVDRPEIAPERRFCAAQMLVRQIKSYLFQSDFQYEIIGRDKQCFFIP